MDKKLEKLRSLGCDIDGALERFMGDEQLYLICLDEMVADKNLDMLETALESGDGDNAFRYAHTLKGVYGNMGIKQAFKECADISSSLKSGSPCEQLMRSCCNIREFIEQIKAI